MPKTIDQPETPAEDVAEAPPAAGFEDTVLALLGQVTEQVRSLSTRVESVEQRAAEPRFVEPSTRRNDAASERSRRALAAEPDGVPHADTIPLFPSGERVPAMVMAQYAPRFGTGDAVRLNLDAVPHGRTDSKTRGELMAEKGVPQGYGEILNRSYLSDRTGQWKYRVKFDPKVMPGSNRGTVELYEQELLPA